MVDRWNSKHFPAIYSEFDWKKLDALTPQMLDPKHIIGEPGSASVLI